MRHPTHNFVFHFPHFIVYIVKASPILVGMCAGLHLYAIANGLSSEVFITMSTGRVAYFVRKYLIFLVPYSPLKITNLSKKDI